MEHQADERNSYWYQRYEIQAALNRRLTEEIKLLTDQSDYWFNRYHEEAELHVATLEKLDQLEWEIDTYINPAEDDDEDWNNWE